MPINIICSTPDCEAQPTHFLEGTQEAYCEKCCKELYPEANALDITEVEDRIYFQGALHNITIEGKITIPDSTVERSLSGQVGDILCQNDGCYKPATKYHPVHEYGWCGECDHVSNVKVEYKASEVQAKWHGMTFGCIAEEVKHVEDGMSDGWKTKVLLMQDTIKRAGLNLNIQNEVTVDILGYPDGSKAMQYTVLIIEENPWPQDQIELIKFNTKLGNLKKQIREILVSGEVFRMFVPA